jgi:hypothetical protein
MTQAGAAGFGRRSSSASEASTEPSLCTSGRNAGASDVRAPTDGRCRTDWLGLPTEPSWFLTAQRCTERHGFPRGAGFIIGHGSSLLLPDRPLGRMVRLAIALPSVKPAKVPIKSRARARLGTCPVHSPKNPAGRATGESGPAETRRRSRSVWPLALRLVAHRQFEDWIGNSWLTSRDALPVHPRAGRPAR